MTGHGAVEQESQLHSGYYTRAIQKPEVADCEFYFNSLIIMINDF